MKCLSLFSGIGGFDLALMNQGHTIVGACEIDENTRQVYRRHFPGVKIYEDATKIKPYNLPDFDIICAGFPCQAFSLAGKRMGFEDNRGTLFFEIIRIAKAKRPQFLLLENVKGLLYHEGGDTFRTMLSTLDELGYDVEWQILNSKYETPQTRERTYIIGHLRGDSTRKILPLGTDAAEIQSNTLIRVGNVDTKGHNSIWGRVYDPKGLAPTLNATAGGVGAKTGLFLMAHTKANIKQRYQKRDTTWTLDTSGGKMGVEMSDGRIRRLMPIECERLQGFPDNWTEGYSDNQRYQMIGNAVTVPVIEYIIKNLK